MSGRGGRGGGRGGFGRGGGRGGGPGANLPPMGLSFQDLGMMDKTPSKLYPNLTSMPKMDKPDDKELKAATYQLRYLEEQRYSPYWPVMEERKQSDLTRFTDRYRPEAREAPSLKTIKMQEEVFPKGLWSSFMEGETKREELKANKKRKRKINWDNLEMEDGQGGDGDDRGDASSEHEDLGDYEDEEDDDYAENYFDNGEDDDGGDDDGGEAHFD
ncbi:hypothetical protein ACQY0O_005738 [Thecaphora frezii]